MPSDCKPRRARFKRRGFGLDLAALRIVEAGEQLALFHLLAGTDHQFGNGRRLGRLDELDLARRNDLALAAR